MEAPGRVISFAERANLPPTNPDSIVLYKVMKRRLQEAENELTRNGLRIPGQPNVTPIGRGGRCIYCLQQRQQSANCLHITTCKEPCRNWAHMECMGLFLRKDATGAGAMPQWICPEHNDFYPEEPRLRDLIKMESGQPLAQPQPEMLEDDDEGATE